MRQFVPHGPEIPSEVLQALEEDRLVLFCGAGISTYTGLPNFRELVAHAFNACAIPLERDRSRAKTPWDLAFRAEQYDKALDLLERKTNPYVMRRAIRHRLIEPLPTELTRGPYVHKAILDLCHRSEGGYRLVTTNYDDRFVLADGSVTDIHDGPRLAPPRPGEWWHPTFLHGRIVSSDPDCRHLVLTSADFGRAYLRDAWAARFVVELFREFTVVFIGYSLNDVVMGYLIDALAADTGPDRQFKRAFALAGYCDDGKDIDRQRDEWLAKNIELIPVNTGADHDKPDFALLNETLVAWARWHIGGLGSRIAETLRSTERPFVPGDEQEARNVAWALSEASGGVARAFAEAENPPDISWLKPLAAVELPGRKLNDAPINLFRHPSPPSVPPGKKAGFHPAPIAGHGARLPAGLPLSPVAFQLARWLTRHLDKQELVDWIVERRTIIHPTFALLIKQSLRSWRGSPPLSKAFQRFWELVIDGVVGPEPDAGAISLEIIPAFRKGHLTIVTRSYLLAATEPLLVASRPFRLPAADALSVPEPIEQLSDVTRLELAIRDDYTLREVSKIAAEVPDARRLLVNVADELTTALLRALRLAEAGDLVADVTQTHWALPSVAAHTQNAHHPGWTVLVELARDAFNEATQQSEQTAQLLVDRWISLWRETRYSFFRRLALYAFASWRQLSGAAAVRLLLERAQDTLWATDTHREVLQLLRQRGATFSPTQLGRLTTAILAGPPRALYADPLPEKEFEELKRRAIMIRLAKLAQGDAALDATSRKIAYEYRRPVPPGADEDRDEFLIWSGGAHWIAPPDADDLLALSTEDAASRVAGLSDAHWSAAHKIQDLARRDYTRALDVMDRLAARDEKRGLVWDAAFAGLEEKQDLAELTAIGQRVHKLIQKHPTIARVGAYGLAGWLAKVAETLSIELEEPIEFWSIWTATWQGAFEGDQPSVEDTQDTVTAAINAPSGKLAEALLARLWKRNGEPGSGLPVKLLQYFTWLMDGSARGHRLARVIVASRLFLLHRLAPDWCRRNIIARMTWSDGVEAEVRWLWQGYLWTPYIGPALLEDLKVPLLKTLAHAMQLDGAGRRQLFGLFGHIAVEQPATYESGTWRRIFAEIPADELEVIADLFRHKLAAAGEKAPTLWREAIAPVFEHNWPASSSLVTSTTSEGLARMLLSSREAFPDALEVLLKKQLLGPVKRASLVIELLRDPNFPRPSDTNGQDVPASYDIASSHPEATLRLLRTILEGDVDLWDKRTLHAVLEKIAAARPQLRDTADYKFLNDFLRRG